MATLTVTKECDTMKKLGEREHIVSNNFEPKEGERTLLPSSRSGIRSPSLDLGISPDSTEDELIGILADILVEGFLWLHEHGKQHTTKGSDLLPGIDKRTS